MTLPSVPRYCQAAVPGGATAIMLEPGIACGEGTPPHPDTRPPDTWMTARDPVPDRAMT